MPLALLPDVERLVVGYLLAADLSAETVDGEAVDVRGLVADRIYSVRPNQADYPCVTVHRWGGGPQLRGPGLRDRDEAMVQIDCWGGTKNEAWAILDACVSALVDGLVGEHPGGVVSRVAPASFWDLPDVSFEPPKPRWVCDVMVATRGRRTA